MLILRIRSKYIFQQLFSYCSDKKIFKIIKYNKRLYEKLDLNYKELLIQKKIEKYDKYQYIENYWINFKNELSDGLMEEENLLNLFYNALSKSKNFILDIRDENFNIIFNNLCFKKNLKIKLESLNEMEDLFPFILFSKNGKLEEKTVKVLQEIFNMFSKNGKMSLEEASDYFSLLEEIEDNELSNLNENGYISFQNFQKYYSELIEKTPDSARSHFLKLGYNFIRE